MKKLITLSVLILAGSSLMAQTNNELSAKEKQEGWQLLFDGKTTQGWHNYLKPSAGPAWGVKDGVIQLDPAVKEGRGDIVTEKEYENFELAIDWNIAEEGNSGIMFIVNEDKAYDNTYVTGPEYQLLDDKKADDNKKDSHLAGSLYDIIAPAKEAENPAGEWNHTVIRLKNGELTFWLNGVQTVQTHLWDANWTELVAKSKFKTWKGFASFHKGHISLQDHGYHISFRNIKIHEL
ncbi:MAG: 3-keto-disaccharide hydrolase [Mucilaginibacter sp.]